jgi:hypothetical protein
MNDQEPWRIMKDKEPWRVESRDLHVERDEQMGARVPHRQVNVVLVQLLLRHLESLCECGQR